MSNKRLVACTSTGCIEYAPERYRKYNIDFIRVHILFEDKEYIEGLDFDAEAFYKKLEGKDIDEICVDIVSFDFSISSDTRWTFDSLYEEAKKDLDSLELVD